MKKILLLFLTMMPLCTWAQMKLEVTDISDPTSVYSCEDRNEMKVIFYCDSSLTLKFRSSYNDVISAKKSLEGTTTSYEIILPTNARGTSYDGRIFEVYADGFDPTEFVQFNHPKSTLLEYKVTNQYIKAKNPYYKCIYTAEEHFKNYKYEDAKNQYLMSKEYPEYEGYKESVDDKITQIDSIIRWRNEANDLLTDAKYIEAYNTYKKIIMLNPNDKFVEIKMNDCSVRYKSDCNIYFSRAEDLYYNKKYKEALDLYQKVLDMDCSQSTSANERIIFIQNEIQSKKDKNSILLYEWSEEMVFGLTIGKCKDNKWGGYFSLHLNEDIFEFPKSKKDPSKFGEASASFGWTKKIVKPVWLHFGIGYAGGGYFELDEENNYYDDDEEDYTLNWYSSIAPEVGAIVKFWHVTLKYTFQYRYCINEEDEEALGTQRHFIGVGFCW